MAEGGKAQLDANSFGVTGLKLNGAVCKSNTLSLSTTIQTDLPSTCLRWIRYISPLQFIMKVHFIQDLLLKVKSTVVKIYLETDTKHYVGCQMSKCLKRNALPVKIYLYRSSGCFLAHLVYQPKSLIQSCFVCRRWHWYRPPWHRVRHRNFIFGIHVHIYPPCMHIKYLVILTCSF